MTPHTSNISMTTTITSRPSSPTRHSNDTDDNDDAIQVRRTIEILSTLLQRLTASIERLLETSGHTVSSPAAIRATEEMKRHYLQLMQLTNGDLCAVVDAFYQTSSNTAGSSSMFPLIRTVSLEEQDTTTAQQSCHTHIVQQQQQTPAPRHLLNIFEGQTTKGISHRIEEEDEDDDLRRLVGSNDYDRNDTRDGAPDERDEEIRDFYQQEQPCPV